MFFNVNKEKSKVSDASDRLSSDFQQLLAASEALLKKTAAHTGEGVDEARSVLNRQLDNARGAASTWQKQASKTARQITSASDEFVHDNPWKAVGIAAVVGIAISLLARAGRD